MDRLTKERALMAYQTTGLAVAVGSWFQDGGAAACPLTAAAIAGGASREQIERAIQSGMMPGRVIAEHTGLGLDYIAGVLAGYDVSVDDTMVALVALVKAGEISKDYANGVIDGRALRGVLLGDRELMVA